MAPSELSLLSAGAVKPGLMKVIDAFHQACGHTVRPLFATAPSIAERISAGEIVDIVIAPPPVLNQLSDAGIVAAAPVLIGRIGAGVMVRSGAPLPKIATVDEFKQSLLDAESLVYNQASTGIYLDSLFSRLGLSAELADKSKRLADFAAVLDHISKGKVGELGFGATTVIIENHNRGVSFVGPLPAAIQNYTTYAAALVADRQTDEAAQEFLRYLTSPSAKSLFAAAGIE